MAREKKNDMRIRVLQERLDWLVENHQVKIQQKTFNFVNDCITVSYTHLTLPTIALV